MEAALVVLKGHYEPQATEFFHDFVDWQDQFRISAF